MFEPCLSAFPALRSQHTLKLNAPFAQKAPSTYFTYMSRSRHDLLLDYECRPSFYSSLSHPVMYKQKHISTKNVVLIKAYLRVRAVFASTRIYLCIHERMEPMAGSPRAGPPAQSTTAAQRWS